jgi:hypothetical protein
MRLPPRPVPAARTRVPAAARTRAQRGLVQDRGVSQGLRCAGAICSGARYGLNYSIRGADPFQVPV